MFPPKVLGELRTHTDQLCAHTSILCVHISSCMMEGIRNACQTIFVLHIEDQEDTACSLNQKKIFENLPE
jgi:hypothetical protein